jgi:hypothetical protein
MWIGKYVTGIFHDQYEVLCEVEQMIMDDVLTKFEVICGPEPMIYKVFLTKYEVIYGLEICERKISRQIWDKVCIATDLKG